MLWELMGIGRKFGRLYGLPERGQTDISSLLKVQCESLIPAILPCLSEAVQPVSMTKFRPGA
jgi:hypothetical protein